MPKEIIVIDDSKLSPMLGTDFPLPIEVIPFGWGSQAAFLEKLGGKVSLRKDGEAIYQTDQGNYILDVDFGPIQNLSDLNEQLNQRVGIVEHGLFLGLATEIIVAGEDGVRILKRS